MSAAALALIERSPGFGGPRVCDVIRWPLRTALAEQSAGKPKFLSAIVPNQRIEEIERTVTSDLGRDDSNSYAFGSSGPLSALWYRLAYRLNRVLKTGNRRAEFEHKYRTHGDYFSYRSKPYEQTKYERTLATVMRARRGRASVLETGCSIGVFTRMLAETFDEVVASDISSEALRLATKTVGSAGNVSYVRSEVEAIDVGRKFDVILLAEVLLFVRERDNERLLSMLDRHLKDDGIIIEVANADRPPSKKFFFAWDRYISERFPIVSRERHEDPSWPYEIVVYARSP
jgi:2-polyprenyl-3-methyl-5-hydroxy-6-metoxy-1,4-benzoquinol methylase